jgi:hypothetical protein
MGLNELIAEHVVDAGEDVEYLTEIIFEQIINNKELVQEIILPALRHEIRNRLRLLARSFEDDSLLSGKPTANPAADRLAFLREMFYCGTAIGMVSWADATIAHHEARIAYQLA